MSNEYNSRPLIAEVMVKGNKFSVVRERNTYEKMLENDNIPDWFDN